VKEELCTAGDSSGTLWLATGQGRAGTLQRSRLLRSQSCNLDALGDTTAALSPCSSLRSCFGGHRVSTTRGMDTFNLLNF